MWSIQMRKLSLSTAWALLLKMNMWLNTIKMDPELYKNLSMKKNKTILKIWGLTSHNLIDLPSHPGLWFKQYVHHSDGEKKKIQRLVRTRMEEYASSKGTQSRGFSLKPEGKENHLKNEDTYLCSCFMRWPYDPEFLRQLQLSIRVKVI